VVGIEAVGGVAVLTNGKTASININSSSWAAMSSLKKKLNDRSNVNRLSTVEDAYSGLPASQTNFKGKWKGYDASGKWYSED